MWRDLYRRMIDPEPFDPAFTEAISILRKSNRRELAHEDAAAQMLAVRFKVLRHRPPERDTSPLPADQVGVHEAMALLRRTIWGESRIELGEAWKEVSHGYGAFEIDGWRITAFKRSRGIKYLDRAVSPVGWDFRLVVSA
jgi:hypothetical protein